MDMKRFANTLVKAAAIITAAALGLSSGNQKAFAYDNQNGMVFSFAKEGVVDNTSSTKFQGLSVNQFYQIYTDENLRDRFSINVSSREEVREVINSVVSEYSGTEISGWYNLNEHNDNDFDPSVNPNAVAASENTTLTRNGLVEIVLEELQIRDALDGAVRNFIDNNVKNNNIKSNYETEADTDWYDTWGFDWYLIKTQQNNGIHVNGSIVKKNVPEVTDDTPEVTDDTPEVTDDTPEVTDDTPEVTDDTPEVTDETPEVTDDTPEVTNEIPAVQPANPLPIVFIYNDETEEDVPAAEDVVTEDETSKEEPAAEEIDLDEFEVPEGAPEADEEPEEAADVILTAAEDPDTEDMDELIDIEMAATPEGLPQTGVADSAVFFGIGFALIGFGAIVTRKCTRKEEA